MSIENVNPKRILIIVNRTMFKDNAKAAKYATLIKKILKRAVVKIQSKYGSDKLLHLELEGQGCNKEVYNKLYTTLLNLAY